MVRRIKKGSQLAFLLGKVPGKVYRIMDESIRRRTLKYRCKKLNADSFAEFRPKCNFIIDDRNRAKYLEAIAAWGMDTKIIADAEQIRHHIFNLLGSGDCYLGEQIDWNADFKTGYKWPNQYYRDIRLVDLNDLADVKVVWELSRFQHLFTLGKAYWVSRDETYALEFAGQISSWIKANPAELSVNWTCAMDVAIRAINWITGYYFFKDSPSLDARFWMEFQRQLYLHGKFIKANLENRSYHNNNHYIADLTGLIWLGLYFGDYYVPGETYFNNPKTWLVFGVDELEKQMFFQVNRDGTNYELSTSYHRLVTELFLYTSIISIKNGIFFSRSYRNRLKKMVLFLAHLMKPNGLTPLVGDADDGRLLMFSNYYHWDKQDFRYLLAVAGEFFNVNEWRLSGYDWREEALWALGSWREPEVKAKQPRSKAFKQGGYYLLKNERLYCLIHCGELSCRGQGGHSHNDQLGLVLSAGQTDLFIDPGVYVYSADYLMRNLFRSTGAHNTLCIDGIEQNDFQPGELFAMPEQSHGECLIFDATSFTGKHYGYRRKLGIIHERTVRMAENEIMVQDTLLGELHPQLDWFINFLLAPEVEVIINENNIQLKKDSWLITLESIAKLDVRILTGYVAKGYGILEKTKRMVIRNRVPHSNSLALKIQVREYPHQLTVPAGMSELTWGDNGHARSSWAIS